MIDKKIMNKIIDALDSGHYYYTDVSKCTAEFQNENNRPTTLTAKNLRYLSWTGLIKFGIWKAYEEVYNPSHHLNYFVMHRNEFLDAADVRWWQGCDDSWCQLKPPTTTEDVFKMLTYIRNK